MSTPEPMTPAEWRRRHKLGQPSLLEVDPEIRAFVDARITGTTFAGLAAEVNARFGPERMTSKSAVHRYWTRHKDRFLATDA
jgi:hypothetical protein